jgi:signal transduction histidine kinase
MRRKDWHKHHPPWWDEEHWAKWEHGSSPPPWTWHREHDGGWDPHAGRLFLRFALAFGLFVLVGCAILFMLAAAALLFFQNRPLPHPSPDFGTSPFRGIFLLLGLIIVLGFVLGRLGRLTARRFTDPLSETMKAADALATGDLSARVSVGGSREFRHLARSFNHMAAALETADRQRRELLADVAHELRTPLTIIQGNLEGLRDGVYQATPEHLDLVLDEAQKLGHLVDDLRLLTLAEAGQLPLDFQPLDGRQLLADIRDAFASQAQEAQVELAVDVVGPLPPLLADPQRIGQVLGNLVANALRHTPAGGRVTLGADVSAEGDAVRLWVADSGEGIPPEDLPRIFDRFWRGDPARSHDAGAGSVPSPGFFQNTPRTGLGLAIAKSLVEAHGGRIWAESTLGQGTKVSCLLPLPPAALLYS